MALRSGTTAIKKIMRGTIPVQRVYRGTVLAWQAAPYPTEGSWGPRAVSTSSTTYGSHTFVESGTFTITHTAYGGNPALRVRINWAAGAYALGSNYSGGSVTASTTRTFAAGDVVDFAAFHTSGSGTASGVWTITKN